MCSTLQVPFVHRLWECGAYLVEQSRAFVEVDEEPSDVVLIAVRQSNVDHQSVKDRRAPKRRGAKCNPRRASELRFSQPR
jgi:hypothetical protein